MRRSLLLALSMLAACSSSPKSPADGGSGDAGEGPIDAVYVDAGPLPYDPTCSMPGTPGNELGVGRFCCDGQPHCETAATDCNPVTGGPVLICSTVSPGVTQWFCTFPCTCDSECGEGAICVGEPGQGQGCVPLVCAAGTPGSPCYTDGGEIHVDAGPHDAGH